MGISAVFSNVIFTESRIMMNLYEQLRFKEHMTLDSEIFPSVNPPTAKF